MRAILIDNPGPDSTLRIGTYETPSPGPDELLVRVQATALNRADLMQRAGKYPVPSGASPILGLEMAGVIEDWGTDCDGWKKGERVFGLLPGGGYAEYVVIPQALAMRVPDVFTIQEAAAWPEVFLTAYQALFWLGDVKQEEEVLLHAGASGVGTAAIQLALEVGAKVYVTASAPKHDLCLSLGAHKAIDYKSEDFVVAIEEITGGNGVDVIVDFIGAPYLKKNIDALGLDGRLVLLSMLGGSRLEGFAINTLFRKRLHIKASTLRSRDLDYKIALTRDLADFAFPRIEEKGIFKPVIDSVFDWQQVEDAHQRMKTNQNAGKIVLRIV